MTNPLDHQVGGDHYSKYKIQPVELIQKLNLNFIQGNIIKYLVRYNDKNGLEDLEKAKHYAEMLKDQIDENSEYFKEFTSQLPLTGLDAIIAMGYVLDPYNRIEDLMLRLNGMIEREKVFGKTKNEGG